MVDALSIGIDEETFWKLNPRKLKLYYKAHAKERKSRLEESNMIAYINGFYVRDAVANVLNGRKAPYPKEPYKFFENMEVEEPKELTEEEKQVKIEELFTRLNIMKTNFDLTKK